MIGGGPSGLMAAEVLINAGIQVDLYDAMPSVGRKFLMAGKGGMNISHAESFEQFVLHYGDRKENVEALLKLFSPEDLRNWVHSLGIDTFIGTSGRVFPKDMKAAPLLRAWLHRLRTAGVNFHMRHQWQDVTVKNKVNLGFSSPNGNVNVTCDAVILALGGGSWPKLGSTGAWVPLLEEHNVHVSPLKPSNCGFEVTWSDYFKVKFSGQPLKSVRISVKDIDGVVRAQTGECVITESGIEGGVIYALSAFLREEILSKGSVTLGVDLLPHLDRVILIKKLSKPRGKASMANHLRKQLGLDGVKAGLLRECLLSADFENIEYLCSMIKHLPVKLIATRPIEEAISSAGGVSFESLNTSLMISQLPGVFCAGEMLDWEAPTGGYLLSACFASGKVAALGVIQKLKEAC